MRAYTDKDASNNFPIGSTCSHLPLPMTPYRCKEITPKDVTSLLGFVSRNNLTLVWGLNDLFGRPTKTKPEKKMCKSSCPPRNTSNYETLLTWLATDTQGKELSKNILAFELGNELNTCLNGEVGARTQAADFATLREKIGAAGLSTLLAGPDTHSASEFQTEGLAWFASFAAAAKTVTDRLTFHMYSLGQGPKLDPEHLDASFLSAASLDKCGQGVRALWKALEQQPSLSLEDLHSLSLWAGETAAANNGGQSGVTDTYIDAFWFLDQLMQFAALNVSTMFRQTFVSSHGYPLVEIQDKHSLLPLPDYWVGFNISIYGDIER